MPETWKMYVLDVGVDCRGRHFVKLSLPDERAARLWAGRQFQEIERVTFEGEEFDDHTHPQEGGGE